MVDYLTATQERLWDIFANGVTNWATIVKPARRLKSLDGETEATGKAVRMGAQRQPDGFPSLSILPRTFNDQGFTAPTARTFGTSDAAATGAITGGCPVVTSEVTTFRLRIVYEDEGYYRVGTVWVPMRVALYRAGPHLRIVNTSGVLVTAGLTYVRTWAMPSGTFKLESVGKKPRLVQETDLRVEYAFTTADINA